MEFVQMPPFSSENISIWFAQAEAVFLLNDIISVMDKYKYAIVHIPSDSLQIVKDIILSPATEDKYERLKYEFIKRLSIQKLKKEEIGELKPSEYLKKLKTIADPRVSDDIIKNIWLNNLPENIRKAIRVETTIDMDRLAEIADKVKERFVPNPPFQLQEFRKQFQMLDSNIAKLSKQVQVVALMRDEDESDAEPSSSNQRSVSNGRITKKKTSQGPKTKNVCWYHAIFGDRAITCIAPCEY